jgi:hypothetical protein
MLRALSVSTDIRQVDVWADRPGRVKVCLLARVAAQAAAMTEAQAAIGEALFGRHPQHDAATPMRWRAATASDAIVAQVAQALLAEDVRPLTVEVDVTTATVKSVQVVATLVHPPGPDGALLAAQARARLMTMAAQMRFRVDLARAQITASLMGDGVRDVLLHAPTQDVPAGPGEIPAITDIIIDTEARRD